MNQLPIIFFIWLLTAGAIVSCEQAQNNAQIACIIEDEPDDLGIDMNKNPVICP